MSFGDHGSGHQKLNNVHTPSLDEVRFGASIRVDDGPTCLVVHEGFATSGELVGGQDWHLNISMLPLNGELISFSSA